MPDEKHARPTEGEAQCEFISYQTVKNITRVSSQHVPLTPLNKVDDVETKKEMTIAFVFSRAGRRFH